MRTNDLSVSRVTKPCEKESSSEEINPQELSIHDVLEGKLSRRIACLRWVQARVVPKGRCGKPDLASGVRKIKNGRRATVRASPNCQLEDVSYSAGGLLYSANVYRSVSGLRSVCPERVGPNLILVVPPERRQEFCTLLARITWGEQVIRMRAHVQRWPTRGTSPRSVAQISDEELLSPSLIRL
jgi:hypothetical protein